MKRTTRLFLLIAAIVAWGNVAKAVNTECTGTSTVSTQADPFTLGYNYTFTTTGTDVTVTFELLDTKVGLVAYVWNQTSGFQELAMANAGGQKFTKTLTGLTLGSVIKVACKFAYAGGQGMAVTSSFNYTVGNACLGASGATLAATTAATAITATAATSGGNVTAEGSTPVTVRGVCWSTTTAPTVDLTTKTIDAAGGFGSFTNNITGLASGIKYYVRAYATNTAGTAYGAEMNFTTLDTQIPTAFSAASGSITPNSVELLLNGTDNSGAVTYTITYGTTTLTTSGTSGTQKSYIVPGLTSATAYAFSVVCNDAAGNLAANNPISVSATTSAIMVPLIGAPTPPAYAPTKVFSIFSDSFTPITGTTDFNPGWGQSTVESTVQIAGNNTLKYSNLNYQGTSFGSHVNAASMKYMHIDIWCTDETSIQITAISPGHEKLVALTPITLNSWNSYDVPLTAFTGVILADLFQVKVVGSGGKTIYLDNMYFYDNTTVTDTNPPTEFTATKGAVTYNSVELLLNATDDSGAINYTITNGSTVLNTGGGSGVQKSFIVTGLASSTDFTFSIVAKDPTGNAAANNPIVVNATTAVGFAVPTTAAPTPIVDASKVISIYSHAYTNVSGINFNTTWNQSCIYTTINVAGNPVMKYENFDYRGIEFGSDVNVVGMNKLHIDVWTPNEILMTISPISHSTGDKQFTLTPLNLNSWNSFNIPLSAFTGVALTDMFQFKSVGSGGKIAYIDNLYFFNDLGTDVTKIEGNSNISCYPNPINNKVTVSAKTEINQVIIRNLLGQSVQTATVNGLKKTIDLSNVSAGNYFITIKLANGQFATQKIVKL